MVTAAAERLAPMSVEHWADRVSADLRELPGVSVNVRDACETWRLPPPLAVAVLATLARRGVLWEGPAGRFTDAAEGRTVRGAA